jgi:hypothetical protein
MNTSLESNLEVDPQAIYQIEVLRGQAGAEQTAGKAIGWATGKDYSLEIRDAILGASHEIEYAECTCFLPPIRSVDELYE